MVELSMMLWIQFMRLSKFLMMLSVEKIYLVILNFYVVSFWVISCQMDY